MHTDVLVVGGGLGGVAAALAALRSGRSVVLTEEFDWLGGQLTSQAVPPDEHTWVEQFGVTASYRALRDGIREYYRRYYPLSAASRATAQLNPGWVDVCTGSTSSGSRCSSLMYQWERRPMAIG